LKPDLEFIMQKDAANVPEEAKNGQAQIESPLKVKDRQELDRVISRLNYGQWYLAPEDWERRKRQGLANQDLDSAVLASLDNS
jgi:hypothetical protein